MWLKYLIKAAEESSFMESWVKVLAKFWISLVVAASKPWYSLREWFSDEESLFSSFWSHSPWLDVLESLDIVHE
jgi:hypothetical protein